MRIAKVVGTLTLNRCLPAFDGACLKLLIPQTLDNLTSGDQSEADTLVGWDQLGSGIDSDVAIAEGPEAAQPFRPDMKAVDCYVAAILDQLSFDKTALKQIKKK